MMKHLGSSEERKREARAMLDRLPPNQIDAVHSLLESMMDPASFQLATAALADQPASEPEDQAVAEAAASFDQQESVTFGRVLADLGYADDVGKLSVELLCSMEAREDLRAMDRSQALPLLRSLERFLAKGDGRLERLGGAERFPFVLWSDDYRIRFGSPGHNRIEVARVLCCNGSPVGHSAGPAAAKAPAADPVATDQPLDMFRLPPKVRRTILGVMASLFCLYFLRFTTGGLTSWFSSDDLMNLHYYWSRPWTALLRANLFFWAGEPRPLGGVFYVFLHRIWGFNPLPFRIGAMVLVALNVVLLFLVVRELSGSLEVACISLIITGVNGSYVSMYYETGMIYDVLAFFCYYGTLYYYLRVRRSGRLPTVRNVVLLMVGYVCALNGKEISVSLPIAFLLYELLWHPPVRLRWVDLKRWTLGPARVAWISGVITLVFCFGTLLGPSSPLASVAYRPNLSVRLFLESHAWYLQLLSLDAVRPSPSGMLGILLATLVIAGLFRKKHLVLASLMIVGSFLPIGFIAYRGGFAFYVTSLYWSLWTAGVLVAARELLVQFVTRKASALSAQLWPRKAVHVLPLVTQFALLAGLSACFVRLNVEVFKGHEPIVQRDVDNNRRYDQEIHKCLPRIPPGARILILNDPWPTLGYEAAFLMRLSYDDENMNVRTLRVARENGDDDDPKHWDIVLDFVDDHFQLARRGQT
jgi:hypothetical protein